jgi:hypothetical protein
MRVKKSLFTAQNQVFPGHLAGFYMNLGALPNSPTAREFDRRNIEVLACCTRKASLVET